MPCTTRFAGPAGRTRPPGYPPELANLLGSARRNLSNHPCLPARLRLGRRRPEGRPTRYELADTRLAHALGDLLGLGLAVDSAACPTADGCC